MRKALVLLPLLALVACEREGYVGVDTPPDAGCTPQCDGKQCGPDGCGGSCGSCDAPAACNADGRCACEPETDVALCERLDARCGTHSAQDRCGQARSVDCGGCAADEACDAETRRCTCVPETDEAMCARLDKHCGTVEAPDNCGAARTPSCGTCEFPKTCNEETNRCDDCVPETIAQLCQAAGVACGPASAVDRCGTPRTIAECGPCGADHRCEPGSGQCVSCAESDAAFCARHAKNCGSFTGLDACEQPRTVDCGTCTGPKVCQAVGLCARPGAPTNDDCDSPERLVFDASGTATGYGTLQGAAADTTSRDCGGTGSDVVYSFTLAAAQDVVISVSKGYSGTPVVSLRTQCGDLSSEIACSATLSSVGSLRVDALAAGTYFVWVGDWNAGAGLFTLQVQTFDPPPAPDNDLCVAAESLTFFGGSAYEQGTTRGAGNDTAAACGATPGGDVVYSFTLAEAASIRATVTRDDAWKTWSPALYVLDACGAGATVKACARSSGDSATATIGALPPGTYYAVVDGTNLSGGDFVVEVHQGVPVTNDTCATVQPLLFDPATSTASVISDTSVAADDAASSCNATSGKDVVYSFEVPTGGRKNAEVSITAPSGSGYRPSASIRKQCDQVGTELACLTGTNSPANLLVPRLDPGVYYLWIDGSSSSANGPVQVDVALTPAPPVPDNDDCRLATPLSFDASTGFAQVSGTTLGAYNQSTGACGTMDGADVVYSFTLATRSRVVARVTRDASSGTYQPAVYLRGACDVASDERACQAFGGAMVTATAEDLPAGDYFAIVDGLAGTEGGFTLEVLAIPTVDNATCATARPLAFDPTTGTATALSSTAQGENHADSSCNAISGAEVVFSFEVPATGRRQDVTVTVTPVQGVPFDGLDPVVSVRRACGSPATELGCVNPSSGAATLALRNLAAGIYFLLVDSRSSFSQGPFALAVTMTDAAGGVPNDGCGSAEVIAIDPVSETALVAGNTSGAGADGNGACSVRDGPDVFYSFSLASEKDVQILVTPTNGTGKPVAWVRSGCSGGAELACNASPSAGAPVPLSLSRLPAGTYHVAVDSNAAAEAGPFLLQVNTATPPPLVPSDTCGSAQRLALDAATSKATAIGSTMAATNDYAGACATATLVHNGPDLVYRMELTAPAHVVAKVARQASSPTFKPAVYLASGCQGMALQGELACGNEASGTARAAAGNFPAGEVYVVIDGLGGTAGDFALEVTVNPPLTNDTCTQPLPIAIHPLTGTGMVRGDTIDALAHTTSTCASSVQPRDLVYSLVIPPGNAKNVEIQVVPDAGSTIRPAVSLRKICDLRETEVSCGYRSTTTPSPYSHVVKRLEPGEYFVWVRGYTGNTQNGPFTMNVTLTDPPAALPNDTCAAPAALSFDAAGIATALGSTVESGHQYSGTCGTSSAPVFLAGDNVYAFTLSEMKMVTATVTPQGASTTSYYPVVYLRRDCWSTAAADELACARPSGGVATANVPALAPGTYYVIVDGNAGTVGDYALQVKAEAPVPNDTCAFPEPLVFDASGHATLQGDTTRATAGSASSCTSAGPDLVYAFTTAVEQAFAAEMAFASGSNRPALYLRSSCGDAATQIACSAASTSPTTRIEVPRLAPGTYFLWADATASQVGPFQLTVDLTAPQPAAPNDACGGAETLAFDAATNTATVTHELTLAVNDTEPTCEVGAGADRVYRFTTSDAHKVVATVTSDAATPAYEPVVYVRSACGDAAAAAELTCANATYGVATATLNALPAGTYYVWVDAKAGTAGRYTLTVELQAPVAGAATNESCANAQVLTMTGTTLQVAGTTLEAQNETAGLCSTLSYPGPDAVYRLTTTVAQKITATVTPGTGYYPQVYIRDSCGSRDGSDELACARSNTAVATTAVVKNAPAGTYWIWVDSVASNSANRSGNFTLDVSLDPPIPAPANDSCASPTQLTRGIAVNGDTTDANQDYGAASAGACATTLSLTSPDLVYSYVPTVDGTFYVTLTPSSAWTPAVWVGKGACGAVQSCIALVTSGTAGAAKTLTVPGATAGETYYIYVEAIAPEGVGPFSIQVR